MTLVLSAGLAVLWLALVGLFVGIGALVLGARAALDETWRSVHASFWAGAAVVTAFLLAWHLARPVDGVPLALCVATAALGLILHRRVLTTLVKSLRLSQLASVGLIALWVANHALNLGAYDDYNYEFQAARWNHDFAIVPGLANLHGRLGFNESHHLLAALLSVGPLAGRVNHVLNGLFVTVPLTSCLGVLASLIRTGVRPSRPSALQAVLVTPLVGLVLFGEFGSMISTLKADVIVACAVFAATIFLLEFVEAAPGSRTYERAGTTVLLICAFAISVKLSAAAFAATLAVMTGRRALADANGRLRALPATVRVGMAIAATILVLVPVRGIVLSGYPAYPSSVAGAPVDWRVSPIQAATDREIITSMARGKPRYELGDDPLGDWLPGWGYHVALDAKFTVLVPALLVLMAVVGFAFEAPRRPPRLTWGDRTILAACLLALGIWWIEAPAPRFGLQYLWLVAAYAVLTISEIARWQWPAAAAASLVAAGVTGLLLRLPAVAAGDRLQIAVVCAGACVWLTWLARARTKARAVTFALVILALAEPAGRTFAALVHRRAEAMQAVWLTPDLYYGNGESIFPTITRQTRSGVTVYLPGRVRYETPLPNTRYFNASLELREAGSLAHGFRARETPAQMSLGYSLDFHANRGAATESLAKAGR